MFSKEGMNMIVIKLWGGLGNQMFQYAFGYALSKKYDDILRLDVDFYQEQPKNVGKRSFQLKEYFDISFSQIIKRPQEVLKYENKYVNKIIKYLPKFSIQLTDNMVFTKEHIRKYMEIIPYHKGKINYYDGYWLTDRYFSDYREDILAEFKLRKSVYEEVKIINSFIDDDNSVAVHIRRGDYKKRCNLPRGYTLDSLCEYYNNAIEYINKNVTSPKYFFFSDDIEWCKKKFDGLEDVVFVTRDSKYEVIADLMGISKCSHAIMSPSTFSWWGNWLRTKTKNNIVIVPKGKYANEYFACSNWIQI